MTRVAGKSSSFSVTGISCSVVTDSKTDVNNQILTVQKAQEALLKQIEAELKKMGVIS